MLYDYFIIHFIKFKKIVLKFLINFYYKLFTIKKYEFFTILNKFHTK